MKPTINRWIIIIAIASSVFAGCGEDESKNSGTRPKAPPARALQRPLRQLRIEYQYEGEIGIAGIPSSATAFDGDKRVAEARFIKIIEKAPGPNHMEIEETHFSEGDDIIYKGKVVMQFAFGGAKVLEVKPISGHRESPIFDSWPSGN